MPQIRSPNEKVAIACPSRAWEWLDGQGGPGEVLGPSARFSEKRRFSWKSAKSLNLGVEGEAPEEKRQREDIGRINATYAGQ
jgi:hypothetical protein